jgi:1-acyl-sn-glycerol-3-phosphate acyltransferase
MTERDPASERPDLPGPPIQPIRRTIRYRLATFFTWIVVRCYARLRVEDRDRLPAGPAVLCFSHQSWADPFVLMAALPTQPRLYFFGPKEEDMGVGARNRLMSWVGTAVPYRPGKNDLLDATRRVGTVFAAGGTLAIAGEGRIHAGERVVLPLSEGPAFFALRSGVPLVPIAVNGTGWLAFGRTIRIRVGEPILPEGRPTRERVEELTERAAGALGALVADFPERAPPGPVGRWLTEIFNEWPDGARPEVPPGGAGPDALPDGRPEVPPGGAA